LKGLPLHGLRGGSKICGKMEKKSSRKGLSVNGGTQEKGGHGLVLWVRGRARRKDQSQGGGARAVKDKKKENGLQMKGQAIERGGSVKPAKSLARGDPRTLKRVRTTATGRGKDVLNRATGEPPLKASQ